MAQEVLVTLTDDLDGSDAAETITFALDGNSYQIDLNAKNAAALRKAVDKYVAAARRTPRGRRSTSRRPARNTPVDPKAVRAWAHEHGIAISSRGRIPTDILSQYLHRNRGLNPTGRLLREAAAPT